MISTVIYPVYIQNLKKIESVPDSNVSAADVKLYETTEGGDPILDNGKIITVNGLMSDASLILSWEQMSQNIVQFLRGGKPATYVFTNIPPSSPSVSSNSSVSSTPSPFGGGSV
jgi:hypothetical protein